MLRLQTFSVTNTGTSMKTTLFSLCGVLATSGLPLAGAFLVSHTVRSISYRTSRDMVWLPMETGDTFPFGTELLTNDVDSPILPVIGSSSIMLVIVGLLYLWERSVIFLRKAVGPTLQPVVESILGEIGGLGFIGLLLSTFAPANHEFLESLWDRLFGESEILLETFEFLHTAFFQVGVGFFVAAGAMVYVGIKKLAEIDAYEELQVDRDSGACTVTPKKLESYLPFSYPKELPRSSLWNEITMGPEERIGKVLLLRSRLTERFELPTTFRIEKYVQGVFAENLLELVELSPLTWIYLIPALSLANSIDLSHDVINANSPNAFESCGYFLKTPVAIWPSLFTVALSSVWGVFNCWKVTQIKYMILPRLASINNETVILSPPVDMDNLLERFDSSPPWIQPIEGLFAEPSKTRYERLFGRAGAAGPELYGNSIKLQSWLCLTHIVFFCSQIVPRDLDAILKGAKVGAPEYLTAELVVYGTFVMVSLLQLVLVSPRAFWNYCLVVSAEDGVSEELLETSIAETKSSPVVAQ